MEYWLWRAMLEQCAKGECEHPDGDAAMDCKETSLCVTEWCTPCAARVFLAEIKRKEA